MPEILDTRVAAYAASLRAVGAIRSDIVEHAFATVERHRCVPQFRYGPRTVAVSQDQPPDDEVLAYDRRRTIVGAPPLGTGLVAPAGTGLG